MIDYAFYKNWNIFCQDVGTEHKDMCVCVCVCVCVCNRKKWTKLFLESKKNT